MRNISILATLVAITIGLVAFDKKTPTNPNKQQASTITQAADDTQGNSISDADTDTGTDAEDINTIQVDDVQNDDTQTDEPEAPACTSKEKIIGEDNSVSANFFLKGYFRTLTVLRVNLGYGAGTGFLVGKNYLMTNNHVISDQATAMNAIFELDSMLGLDGKDTEPMVFKAKKDGLFITDAYLDYSIIELEGCPGEELDYIDLSKVVDVTIDDRIIIIGHPLGGPKKTVVQDNKVTKVGSNYANYKSDTQPGSSGSVGFNNKLEPAIIHTSATSNPENQGTLLTAVVKDTKDKLADLENSDDILSQLGLVTLAVSQ